MTTTTTQLWSESWSWNAKECSDSSPSLNFRNVARFLAVLEPLDLIGGRTVTNILPEKHPKALQLIQETFTCRIREVSSNGFGLSLLHANIAFISLKRSSMLPNTRIVWSRAYTFHYNSLQESSNLVLSNIDVCIHSERENNNSVSFQF